MAKIFISYSRADTQNTVGHIDRKLRSMLPNHEIFFDIDSIPDGVDYRQHLQDSVKNCDYLLAMIGDRWITVADEQGKRKVDNEDDWVRNEIEWALANRIHVIPVLIGIKSFPNPGFLPASLSTLPVLQHMTISPHPYFDFDVERLAHRLEKRERVRKSRQRAAGGSFWSKVRRGLARLMRDLREGDDVSLAAADTARLAAAQSRAGESAGQVGREQIETRETGRDSQPQTEAERPRRDTDRLEQNRRDLPAAEPMTPIPAWTGSDRAAVVDGPVAFEFSPPLEFSWPKKWSLLDPGAVSKIRWTHSMRDSDHEVDRFSLELHQDGVLHEVLHQSTSGALEYDRVFPWKVGATIPQRRNWQVKLRVWDKLGRVSEESSEPFPSAVTHRGKIIGGAIGALVGLIMGVAVFATGDATNAGETMKGTLSLLVFVVPVATAVGMGAAYFRPLRILVPICLVAVFGLGAWLAPEREPTRPPYVPGQLNLANYVGRDSNPPTLQDRMGGGTISATLLALIALIPIFQRWQNATGRDVIRN